MNKYTKFAVTASVLLMLFVLNIAEAAWTAPTAVPPGNNTSAPINVSATYQTKIGGFGLSGVLSALGAGNRVTSPKFCLNTDGSDTNCVSGSWPTGGGTSGTNYWSLNGSALYNNTGSVIGINNSNPNTGALMDINGSGKSYGLLSQNASYGVYGQGSSVGLYGYSGSYGVYGNGGSYGIYGYGGTSGVYGTSGSIGVRGEGTTYGMYGYSSSGHGVYGQGAGYGVFGNSVNTNPGVYGQNTSSGPAAIFSSYGAGAGAEIHAYGTGPSIKITDNSNTQGKNGTVQKILATKPGTSDGSAAWYLPSELGLSGGTSGGITGSGTGWTIPVFGGSAGAANQTSITNSPATVGYSSSFQDISTMVINLFPISLWGTKTNTALDINGKIKITDGYQGTNKILASDANGLATWRTASELGLGGVTNLTSYTQLPSGSIAGYCSHEPFRVSAYSAPSAGIIKKFRAPATKMGYSTNPSQCGSTCDICTGCASGWSPIFLYGKVVTNINGTEGTQFDPDTAPTATTFYSPVGWVTAPLGIEKLAYMCIKD